MSYKISSEVLGPLGAEGFARLVAERIAVLEEYDVHAEVVRRHAADPDMKPEERWVTLAIPQAPVEVDAAIKHTPRPDGTTAFTADYEIIGPTLEQKKAKLFDLVSAAERDAIKAVVPAGKIRAYQFREADIRKAVMLDGTRSDEDARFLDEQAAREDQRQEIYRWAANLHSNIEDLTDATVDAFEVKPFHG